MANGSSRRCPFRNDREHHNINIVAFQKGTTMAKSHTIVAYVEDRPGVLARIASLFRRRGFNIESLTVGHTNEPGLSRMTIAVDVNERMMVQVERQLFKLIEVVSVVNISGESIVDRELTLFKVVCGPETKNNILEIVDTFRADVVDVDEKTMIVQLVADEGKMEELELLLRPFGILETVSTGRVAMVRGAMTSKPDSVTENEREAEAARAQMGRRPEGILPFTSD